MSTNPCRICRRPTTMWCSRCQRAWYCSAQHLENDWPLHRKECVVDAASMTPYSGTSPIVPRAIHVAAVLFAPDQDRPQLITVSCQPSPSQTTCASPLVHNFFPEGAPQSIVLTQGLNGDPLRFPLHLFYCPAALARGSPPNRAIARITSNAAVRPWAGMALVLKFNGTRKQGYADASMNDLPTLSAYFLGYR